MKQCLNKIAHSFIPEGVDFIFFSKPFIIFIKFHFFNSFKKKCTPVCVTSIEMVEVLMGCDYYDVIRLLDSFLLRIICVGC